MQEDKGNENIFDEIEFKIKSFTNDEDIQHIDDIKDKEE